MTLAFQKIMILKAFWGVPQYELGWLIGLVQDSGRGSAQPLFRQVLNVLDSWRLNTDGRARTSMAPLLEWLTKEPLAAKTEDLFKDCRRSVEHSFEPNSKPVYCPLRGAKPFLTDAPQSGQDRMYAWVAAVRSTWVYSPKYA